MKKLGFIIMSFMKYNVLKNVVVILILSMTTSMYSQNVRGYVKDEKGKSWLVVDVTPQKQDCTDMYICFDKRLIENFVKNLNRWGKKAQEWTETAKNENVKDFEKQITNIQASEILGLKRNDDFSFVHYTAYGIDFETSIAGVYAPAGTYYKFNPFFVIDPIGTCYLELRVKLPSQKAKSAIVTESTGVSGTNNGNIAVGASESRQTFTYDPEGFTFKIRTSDLASYVSMLEESAKQFGKNKDDYKEKKKIFK